jgi:WD40 repeat protein
LCFLIGLTLLIGKDVSAQAPDVEQKMALSASGYERANTLAFSPDGKHLAVGGMAGVYLFDFQERTALDFIETKTWVRSLVFLPESNTLAGGLFDHTIRFWEIPATQALRTITGPRGWVRSVAVSGDGALIASASDDDTLRIWNVQTGAPVLVIDKDTTGIRAAALSPDGRLVAGALGDNTVRVWRVEDRNLLYTLKAHIDWVRCLAFSPDGQMLASGSFDKNIHLWNMADGSLSQTLAGHTSSVLAVSFSPDGATLASGSVDETVRLWQVDTGELLRVFTGHTDFVYSVTFSPNGKFLASGGGDNAVRIWPFESLPETVSAATGSDPGQDVPSDCRACHHRRGENEPARVLELSCEGCHANGISQSWCAAFPRAGSITDTPTAYQAVRLVSGVPVVDPDLAVVISSPANGETFYVKSQYSVTRTIKGKLLYAQKESITKVKIQLQILSAGQETIRLEGFPSERGEFSFNVGINPGSPSVYSPSFPSDLFCRSCHPGTESEAGLPIGEVRIIVMASAPDGRQATDERWLRVDSSDEISIPVQVVDALHGQHISNLSIQASTILYDWRGRTSNTTTDYKGEAPLSLESLSQSTTEYEISVPPQRIDGYLYQSDIPVRVILTPGKTSYPMVTLTARSQSGAITGNLTGDNLPAGLERATIWAFRLPAGPTYQTSLDSDLKFVFRDLPLDQFLIFPDPSIFSKHELSAPIQKIDLTQSPQAAMSMTLSKTRPISGKVMSQDGHDLAFAWVTAGEDQTAVPINPHTGEYLVSDLPSEATFLTVSAPGYYSLSKFIGPTGNVIDFQLVPRTETRRIAWGDGEVVLPPETIVSVDGSDFELGRGWIWGSGGASEPLEIHMSDMVVIIPNGKFALERLSDGTGWLYLSQGKAQVMPGGNGTLTELDGGEMIALVDGAAPLPMEAPVVAGLRSTLNQAPILEVIEPSFMARLENGFVKAGIRAAQAITFATYMLMLLAMIAIPFILFFWSKKRRQKSSIFTQ